MYNTPVNPFQNWRSSIWQFIRSKSVLSILVLINVAVWLTLAVTDFTVYVSTLLFNGGIQLKPIFRQFLAYPADYWTALIHPWSMVTSLFVHDGFWQLLFNMMLLLLAGHIFLQYKSGKSLLATYLVGGVFGNLLFQAAYHIFPALRASMFSASFTGASAAVLAVLIAVAVYQPNHPIRLMFFGQIRLKWVALIFIGLMVLPLIDSDFRNLGSLFAYLGGAIYGAIVAVGFRSGWKFFAPKPKKKKEKFYTSYQAGTPKPDQQQADDEKRVEEILDKISKDGYGALSKEEKDFLYHYKKN